VRAVAYPSRYRPEKRREEEGRNGISWSSRRVENRNREGPAKIKARTHEVNFSLLSPADKVQQAQSILSHARSSVR